MDQCLNQIHDLAKMCLTVTTYTFSHILFVINAFTSSSIIVLALNFIPILAWAFYYKYRDALQPCRSDWKAQIADVDFHLYPIFYLIQWMDLFKRAGGRVVTHSPLTPMTRVQLPDVALSRMTYPSIPSGSVNWAPALCWGLKSLYSLGETNNVQGCQRRHHIHKLHTSFCPWFVTNVKRSCSNWVTMTPLYNLSWL